MVQAFLERYLEEQEYLSEHREFVEKVVADDAEGRLPAGADVDVEYNFAVGKAELDPVYAVFADDYEMMVFHIVQDEMAAGLNMASVATEEADFEKVVYRNEPAAEMAADSEIAFAVQEAVAMQADFEKVVFHNKPGEMAADSELIADSEIAFAVQEAVAMQADFEKVVFHNKPGEMAADSELIADSEIAFAAQEAVAMQADFEKVVFHNAPADEMAEVAADSEVAFAVQEAVHIVMDETAAGLNMASVATEEADYEKVVFHNESE